MFQLNMQILRKLLFIKTTIKYNLKFIYLTINRNNKDTIGYTIFDKTKIIQICTNNIYCETKKLSKTSFIVKRKRVLQR